MANQALITVNDLITKFRASGQYTIYRDATQQPNVTPNVPVRLLPGFSRKGPINFPVLINQYDTTFAQNLYGAGDEALERKGSWFHNSLNAMLQAGPVMALNLLITNNEVDQLGNPTANADAASYKSFSTSPSDMNGTLHSRLLASYYNKERFWFLDPEYLLATRLIQDKGSIFNIVSTSQTKYSIIITKSNVLGYNIKASDWYTDPNQPMPSYVRPTDLMSDFFLDVYVVLGNFGPDKYAALSVDPLYGEFFDANGLIIEKSVQFFNTVGLYRQYTGCLIPGFTDKTGISKSLETMINNESAETGLMCAIDKEMLDAYETGTNTKKLDLVGHSFLEENITDVNFLSYKRKLTQDFPYERKDTNISASMLMLHPTLEVTSNVGSITVEIENTSSDVHPNFTALSQNLQIGTYIKGIRTLAGLAAGITVANPVLRIKSIQKSASRIEFVVTSDLKSGETVNSGSFVDIYEDPSLDTATYWTQNSRFTIDSGNSYYVADMNSQIAIDYLSGSLTNGDKITYDSTPSPITRYVQFTKTIAEGMFSTPADNDYRPIIKISLFADSELTIPAPIIDFDDSLDSAGYPVEDNRLNFVSLIGTINERLDVTNVVDNLTIEIPISYFNSVKVGQFIAGVDINDNPIMARILQIQKVGAPVPTALRLTLDNPAQIFTAIDVTASPIATIQQIEKYVSLPEMFDHYEVTYLDGFTLKAHSLPNGTNQRVREIYSVMTTGTLSDALVDPEISNFRYLVDTFNFGLETQSKSYLTQLLLRRQKTFGIINTPSVTQFKDSQDPRFTNTPTAADPVPTFNTNYVLQGGNITEHPSFLYTLPSEANGASYAASYFPNLKWQDAAGNKKSVPPAAYVSNKYLLKWSANPFSAVAGTSRGVIDDANIVGCEYPLTKTQRGDLETKGINPIYQRGDGRIVIYGDKTQYQTFRSILNAAHARDTLITMEIDLENILDPFTFDYNDATLQTQVEAAYKTYLNGIRDGYGAISEYTFVMDSSNNPEWVGTFQAAIIDISVTIPDVASKFITRITLTNKAGVVGAFTSI